MISAQNSFFYKIFGGIMLQSLERLRKTTLLVPLLLPQYLVITIALNNNIISNIETVYNTANM